MIFITTAEADSILGSAWTTEDKKAVAVNQANVWLSTNYRDWETDRKSTRLNSSHSGESRMPSSA